MWSLLCWIKQFVWTPEAIHFGCVLVTVFDDHVLFFSRERIYRNYRLWLLKTEATFHISRETHWMVQLPEQTPSNGWKFSLRWGTVPPANSLSFSPHLNTFHFTKDLLWPRRFQEKKTSQSSLNRVYVILFVLSIKMKALALDCTIEMKNSADFPSRFISHHRKASALTFQRWVCRPWVKFWNRRTHTFQNTHTHTRATTRTHTHKGICTKS